jgi:hypothetical protein
VVLEPWHGPTVLALSEQHGVDVADLPALLLIASALAVSRSAARGATATRRWSAGYWVAATSALGLGAVLFAGVLDPRVGSPLIAAGGGTFDGNTQHVDGLRADPVGRWSHLAVTYDGAAVRLYVNGVETTRQLASGTIRRTIAPLWIGGNRPYGEYFRGVIDDVRVYDRALGSADVRAAMSTPLGGKRSHAPGLVAAYAFDAGTGGTVGDASGNGNSGTIRGATWTRSGRFGGGMTFDGAGQVVSVPASASLNLTTAMTLTAWMKPSETQSGWRTVLARQTDAYILMAGGGRGNAGRLEGLDQLRFVLVILLAACMGLMLARGHSPWAMGRRRWHWPVGLFLAGSVVDVAFTPSDTLIGLALVAIWCGVTATGRHERVSMCILSAAFGAVTILSVANASPIPLPRGDGGVVRSAALGMLLATATLLSLGGSRRAIRLRRAANPAGGAS